jgi:assimilatory nitrate reductase catalytic subunit
VTEVRSVCPYCGVGCGLLVRVRRGRVDAVRGDPSHPANRGGLCAKGLHLAGTARTGDRLLHPMARRRPDEPFRRVDWPDAIDRVAGAIRRAVAEHGPGSVALYLSGQLLTEDYYAANKLGKGLIGTASVDTNSRLCMASTVVAYQRAFGADGPPGCYEDLDLARHVLVAGSNLAETHPVLFGRVRAGGAHLTVVDPRRTATAAAADEHLAIRPGTDVALLLGMARALFEAGLVDEPAVDRACSGLAEMRTAAAAMPPERAAAICGVPADVIRAAAARFAGSPAALSLWCQGLNQAANGTDRVTALIDLHLLTGQLGRPGTGPFSLTGQANAMGGREVGGMATVLACHRGWDDEAGRAEVERHWGLGPLPAGRGLTAVELVEAIAERRVRVLWVACTNPLASLPDGRAVREALGSLDLLVVQDVTHPTDTGELAHVLLPASAWAEKTGTLTSSERRVALAERAVPPPGEARPDWAIFAAAGAALGAPAAFAWREAAEVFAEHVALTAGRDLDMTGLSHELLAREGPQHWPYPAGGRPRARRYEDGRCHTPDGRPRLVPVAHREPAEPPTAGRPLRLVTGRERDRWHTETRTGRVAALRGGWEARLHLHPGDADGAGLAEGDLARVTSARGGMHARIVVDPAVPAGSAFLPFHVGPLLQPGGWANALTVPSLDPASLQPELKHAAVRVERATGVALAGGALAAAVARELAPRGQAARAIAPGELDRLPDAVLRVLVAEGALAATPWWEVAAAPPTGPGRAVLDLGAAAGAAGGAAGPGRRRLDGGLARRALAAGARPPAGRAAPRRRRPARPDGRRTSRGGGAGAGRGPGPHARRAPGRARPAVRGPGHAGLPAGRPARPAGRAAPRGGEALPAGGAGPRRRPARRPRRGRRAGDRPARARGRRLGPGVAPRVGPGARRGGGGAARGGGGRGGALARRPRSGPAAPPVPGPLSGPSVSALRPLFGLRIAVLQTRYARELAALLEREGGQTLLAPCLREVRAAELRDGLLALVAAPVHVYVFQTGVGTRALFDLAAEAGLDGPLLASVRGAVVVARGPKPLTALLELGLRADRRTQAPHTTEELRWVLDAVDLAGRRVAVQHYGSPNEALLAYLRDREAEVVELSSYRWALPADVSPIVHLLDELGAGRVDVAAFTSASQVENLFAVAARVSRAGELPAWLNERTTVASIGPTCGRALERRGVRIVIRPERPKMVPFVRAIRDHFSRG